MFHCCSYQETIFGTLYHDTVGKTVTMMYNSGDLNEEKYTDCGPEFFSQVPVPIID